jgi:hypothetical protein
MNEKNRGRKRKKFKDNQEEKDDERKKMIHMKNQ